MSHEQNTPVSIDTLDEQRKWIAQHFDETVAASGVAEGWFDIFNNEVFWAEDREIDRYRILGSLFPRGCGGTRGRLDEMLKNHTADDPMAAAARVRAQWESEGWVISDIRPFVEGEDTYFRADRDDGAILAFGAGPDGMTLEAATRCSAHSTVSNSRAYPNEESFHVKKLRELQDEAGIPWGDAAKELEAETTELSEEPEEPSQG